jgi:flagellar hook-associated protein 3 FlgL
MSITGPGSITAAAVSAQTNMSKQLDKLSEELGTGQAAQTYSGLGSQAGLALSLKGQLSAIDGYDNTATTVGTTLSIAQSVLNQIGGLGSTVEHSVAQQGAFSLDNNGQTPTQEAAASYLDQILSLLNTQVGSNYIFSGGAVNQPSVAGTDEILNGNGAQAGLRQVISEREQADLGAGGLGRLLIPAPSGSTVSISEDGSAFGFKLAGVNSSLTGATVSGPSSSPPSISVDLGSNPNAADWIQLSLTLPDGSSQNVTLQATTASPPGADQFTIGAHASDTATNLQAALAAAVGGLAQTALPAASAIAAANNFFSSDPPQRVRTPRVILAASPSTWKPPMASDPWATA